MKKLHAGTDVIAIKDAIAVVQKSIQELTLKKESVKLKGYAGRQIFDLYDEKIAKQSATLTWLQTTL